MSRIGQRFADLKQQQRKALIPYITAGDPQPDVTVPLLHALVEAGADLLEIGVPFSDPMADGPVIQAACERALAHHVSLHQVLDMVTEFRRGDDTTPVILMGYLNPIEVWGYGDFARAAGAAGVDGVLTVDMPPEESRDLAAALREQHIDTIYLLAPTSDARRMQLVG
ncbi:MAG: tryptophan synthase subunit alpha, partial [Gammaproteobacteria bacterium]|nr:tryptophan synthase subunit alpha [Gammaproteobacteria bacterium]